MILDHIGPIVSDHERSKAFHAATLAPLQLVLTGTTSRPFAIGR